jgi:hypothetical protein
MANVALSDPREALGWVMQSVILLLRAGAYPDALALLGWETHNRVTPVHPDQVAELERLVPAARADLGEDEAARCDELLANADMRTALALTRSALVTAARGRATASSQ